MRCRVWKRIWRASRCVSRHRSAPSLAGFAAPSRPQHQPHHRAARHLSNGWPATCPSSSPCGTASTAWCRSIAAADIPRQGTDLAPPRRRDQRHRAERLGVGTIRGSGDHGHEFHRKGGFRAFREMLGALRTGLQHGADRRRAQGRRAIAGLGIVKLAQVSGRPIYPVAVATSRRIELNNWDRSAINLPFGRSPSVVGDAISVARDADDETLEAAAPRGRRRAQRARPRAPMRWSTARTSRQWLNACRYCCAPTGCCRRRLLPFAPLLFAHRLRQRQRESRGGFLSGAASRPSIARSGR